MKMIAHSTAPVKQPFIHLGYVSATIMKFKEGFPITMLFTGITLLLTGLLLAMRLKLGKNLQGFMTVDLVPRKSGRLWLWGGGTAIAGIIVVAASFHPRNREIVYQNPTYRTEYVMDNLAAYLETAVRSGENIPEDVKAMGKKWKLEDETVHDGWFNELAVNRTEENGTTVYSIVSAGPDEEFGTYDDIVYPEKIRSD